MVRSCPSYVIFILLADSINEKQAIESLKAGANDYVLKNHIIRFPYSVLNAVEKQTFRRQKAETEDKLHENEAIYRYIIENSHNAVFLIKNQKFELINSAFEKMFEYSFEEVSQPEFSIASLASKELRQEVAERFKKLAEERNGKQQFEFTAISKTGKIIEADAWITHNVINQDVIVQGIIRDITDFKATEKHLLESEKKFKILFQDHSAAKLIVDPDSGNILEANKAAAVFYGWEVEQLQQMNISQLSHIPLPEVNIAVDTPAAAASTFSEVKQINSRGEIVDVEIFRSRIEYGDKNVLHYIIHDITARKKAEQKLHLLNHAVEQNPVAIVITNPFGIIEYVNPEFTSMTGYSLDEVIGQSPRMLKSGFQDNLFYSQFWKTISSGQTWEGEFKNRKKNGELYWQESSISPILDEKGVITHFVAVLEDITDKKNMIEDLVRAKEKAEESDRLKSAFLANMSHEIRTPMNGIIGFTDLLKEHRLSGKEKIKYIDIIKKSGERMLNTINDLIEISQIESGTIEIESDDININDQMDAFYHQFETDVFNKGLKLSYHKEFPDSQAMIETDVKKLHSIFGNLLKNAVKYTFAGSIRFGYREKDNFLEFFIKDTGIGIEATRHRIIFDRFVQADMSMTKPYEGAGLGLSIAKAYINMMGGEIWLKSNPGEGTEFYFTIPLKRKPLHKQEKSKGKKEKSEHNLLKELTVLVAEDDSIGKLYLEELLAGSCKELIFASDGIEALQLFEANADKIDVVLMDMKMPGMNGYETTRMMKNIKQDVFIVAQTAYALSGDREKAFESGCDDYLAKPFSKSQLVDAIKHHYC